MIMLQMGMIGKTRRTKGKNNGNGSAFIFFFLCVIEIKSVTHYLWALRVEDREGRCLESVVWRRRRGLGGWQGSQIDD